MPVKRSIQAQLQEIDAIIAEGRGGKQADYRRATQEAIRETLLWCQNNKPIIEQIKADRRRTTNGGAA
ncbi:hypothetical protein R5W60_21625 (plasmid) [Brucella pseudintermedia]|uniref:hypothetical protein n=1 Tax=Brucella pseudintermedia TaxID=370111 RepID=UPI002AC96262|nr:hypothetical protein [Brucella pseudintermedia]WPM83098.1 hypothetical protein R5W60_21625 [Brucella pseudintermedia]